MNEKLNKLNREIHGIRLMAFACIAALVVSLVLLLMRNPFFSPLLLAVSAFYLFVVRRRIKRYQKHVEAATLEESFRPFLKEINYTEKNGIPQTEVTECGLFPAAIDNRVLVRTTVTGTYKLQPVSLSEVTLNYEDCRTRKDGTEKKTVDYLSGCFLNAALSGKAAHSYVLWAKDLTGDHARSGFFEGKNNISAVQLPELRNRFSVYTEEADAFTVPEDTVKALLHLADYTPGTVALRVDPDSLKVFIKNRFLYNRVVPVRIDLTAQILQSNPFPELGYLLRLADAVH